MIETFFEQARDAGRPLVAAFIVETQGSTYRKPGTFMLFDADEGRCGLLSGGCLEGDLHDHARALLRSGERCLERSYDSRGSDDPIWGLGLGCEGLMRVLLLRIDAAQQYEPVASLLAAARNRMPTSVSIRNDRDETFVVKAERTPTLLVCGAGPDAEPVCAFAVALGWRVTVVDHRPAYVDAARFEGAAKVSQVEAESLGMHVSLPDFDAAIVMSHHLIADGRYLAALADSAVGYVGLLGPAARRERLFAELGAKAELLRTRLRAPVGLDLGGRSPEEIALSIVAEVQAVLHEKSGAPFSTVR